MKVFQKAKLRNGWSLCNAAFRVLASTAAVGPAVEHLGPGRRSRNRRRRVCGSKSDTGRGDGTVTVVAAAAVESSGMPSLV